MIMSVGGLIGATKVFDSAAKKGCSVYIPSGAICGLDGIKAARCSSIKSAVLTTRKPPRALEGAPYILKKKINLSKLKKDTVIFDGTARQAAKAFPKNINVAASLSLAGIGFNRTKVRIIACPGLKKNSHCIEAKGSFGRIVTQTENVPSPGNPKTSFMAILSAIAALGGIINNSRVGT